MAYTLTSALESQKQVDTLVQASLLSLLILLFLLYFSPSLLLSFHACCFHVPLGYFLSVEPQLYEGRDLTTNLSLLQYNAWYVAQYWSKKKKSHPGVLNTYLVNILRYHPSVRYYTPDQTNERAQNCLS